MKYILALFLSMISAVSAANEAVLDLQRNRTIPVEVTLPSNEHACTPSAKCNVAFVSAGYGVPHTSYQFLSDSLSRLGLLVVAIGHELAGDPPLSVSGNLYETRKENWKRGSDTLKVVRREFSETYPAFDFDNLLLVGHSNGGDISAWLALESPSYVTKLITLDHRRVPLPRSRALPVLSIRASDYEADDGVLHSEQEQAQYNSCIVNIPQARHNDMSDYGPDALKLQIQGIIQGWLAKDSCNL